MNYQYKLLVFKERVDMHMKYLKLLFSAIVILMFIGCQSETTIPILATPVNLEYDGLLTWDEVDNASSYDVVIIL